MGHMVALREKEESKVGEWGCPSVTGASLRWESCIFFFHFYFFYASFLKEVTDM